MADANMYVLNPFFQTKSFDEMVKPLALYAQAYKEQEAKIEDMTDKAAALEWIANLKPDSQTAALYRDMSDKIKGIRDDMMMNGLTGGLRSRILGARRMYSANSAEITRRYEDMLKYQQRMEQLYDKDNSIVFSPESQDVSLDDFAGGKRPKIKAISGNEIMARGAAVGKRLTSQMFGDGVLGQEMGGQFWKVYQSQGMDDNALWNALQAVGQASESKFNMAKQVIDGVYNSFKDFSPYDQQRLKDRFIEGVYSGSVYNRQVNYQQNMNFESDAARDTRLFNKQMAQNQDRRAQEEHNAQMIAAGWVTDGNGKWIPTAAAVGYGGKGKGSGSGSGSSSGSGDGATRVIEYGPIYMTGDDDGWHTARIVDGAPVTKYGDDDSIEDGDNVHFVLSDTNTLELRNDSDLTIAAYDINNYAIKNEDALMKEYGYHGVKLLKKLLRGGVDIAEASRSYDALNNYNVVFRPDSRKFIGDHNGLISILPNNRVMPTANDGSDTSILATVPNK